MSDEWIGRIVVGALIACLAFVVCAVIGMERNHARFITECVADGRKHYECEAMYGQANPPSQVIPVVIPVSK